VILKIFCCIKSSCADSLVRWLIYRNVSDTDCVFIIGVLISNSHAGDGNVGEFEPPNMAVSLQKFD
jgi:hypothetical protein